MGIAHIEDLSTQDFMSTLETLDRSQATEKLDGANLYFGIDLDTDRLFTSREGKKKNATRYFSADDYPYFSGTNPFRAAHLALEEVEPKIRQAMQAGQTVEIEVLFGKQPNAIMYGAGDKSYIAFLRGVNGTTSDVVDRLTGTLLGTTATVETKVVSSTDGDQLDLVDVTTTFEFIGPQTVDMTPATQDPDFKAMLEQFNKFLNSSASGLPDGVEMTNGELDATSMSSIKIVDRPAVKAAKEKMQSHIMRVYKMPIKKFLLGKLTASSKSKLAVSDENVDDKNSVGIEGIVLRDPTSGELVKLVDKTAFTAINSFNHTVRGQISGTVRTVDDNAPLESRGGVVGHMKIQIAKALGNPDLARAGQAKKIIAEFEGETPVETLKEFADSLNINDFQGKKNFILAIIKQAQADLTSLRDEFNSNKDEYSLTLPGGKIIGISDEVEKRTMLSFAEAQANLKDLEKKVKSAPSLPVLLAVLYGHAVPQESKLDTENAEVMEAVAKKKKTPSKKNSARWDNDTARFAGKDSWSLMNIYFATVMLATLMYKANDRLGLRMLQDKTNFRMASIHPTMSTLNFWGYPIWKSNTDKVKKLIGAKAAKEINTVVRRVPTAWYKFLHMDLSFGRDVPINWNDHYKTMTILQQYPGMKFERVSFLLKGLFGYENLSYDQKLKVLNALHLYVAQFIPGSPLFARMKDVQRQLMFNPNDLESIMTLTELQKPPVATNETADAGAVGVGATAPLSGPLFGSGKKPTVVKRKRNTEIKHLSFKKPENCPVK